MNKRYSNIAHDPKYIHFYQQLQKIDLLYSNYSDERVLCSAPQTSSEKKLRKIFSIGALRT